MKYKLFCKLSHPKLYVISSSYRRQLVEPVSDDEGEHVIVSASQNTFQQNLQSERLMEDRSSQTSKQALLLPQCFENESLYLRFVFKNNFLKCFLVSIDHFYSRKFFHRQTTSVVGGSKF